MMFSVIFLFFFLERAFLLGHVYEYLKREVSERRPPDLLVSSEVKPERVDVLEHALHSPVDVALLRLGFRPEHVRDLGLFPTLIVVLQEEIPAEGRLHVVHEGTLLVLFSICLLLLFGAVWQLQTTVVQILLNDLFHISHLLALETLQKDVVLDVLKHVGVNAAQLLCSCHESFFLFIIEVLLPDPHSL